MTKPQAIQKATKMAWDKGLRVRFGFAGEVFAIDEERKIFFKAVSVGGDKYGRGGDWVEEPSAVGTEAPDVLRKLSVPEPEEQEGF